MLEFKNTHLEPASHPKVSPCTILTIVRKNANVRARLERAPMTERFNRASSKVVL
jgi:hypothetical protein